MTDYREEFSSKIGLIVATIGSVVGLGNIWRFPYIVGKNGGAAFLIIYIILLVLIGIPLMMSEFIVGREGKSDAVNSYKKIAPKTKWYFSGVIGILAAFFTLTFYGVVAGWTIEYTRFSILNKFINNSSQQNTNMFLDFISHPIKPVITLFIAMSLAGITVSSGLQKGIEKVSRLIIPILVVLLIILNIYSLSLEGGKAGFEFLFKPDFSHLTWKSFLIALGHAFFSLSLGMGVMVTYGSYIPDRENLFHTAIKVSIADTLVAIMAGIAIFPAVFAFDIAPSSGFGLIFMSLPNVFSQMTGGYFFSIAFFSLLFLAALSSTISILESIVAYLMGNFNLNRKISTFIATSLTTLIGIVASLSNGPLKHIQLYGQSIFDFINNTSSNWLLTTSALLAVLFVGWNIDSNIIENQLTNNGTINKKYIVSLFKFIAKYIAPIGIILIFIFEVLL